MNVIVTNKVRAQRRKLLSRLIVEVLCLYRVKEKDLAERLNVSPRNLNMYKHGKTSPSNNAQYQAIVADLNRLIDAKREVHEPPKANNVSPEVSQAVNRLIEKRAEPSPSQSVMATAILQKAAGHIGDRAATYDRPEGERSMAKTVCMFNELVGGPAMTTEQGWLFMGLLKMVRSQQGNFKQDNYEDGAAYFALAAETAAQVRS